MSSVEPTPRSAALTFVLITVVIDALTVGIVLPVLPKLVLQFAGGTEDHGVFIYGLFGTTFALMQFFFSPIMGGLSDRYGRRSVILFANFGLGVDYVLMALAPSLTWLFVGRVIAGITGASFTAAGAYIADVTPPEKRSAAFGMMGAAFGVGFVLGPMIGGLLGSLGNDRLPFWFAAVITLVNATYGYFILPESLALEHRRSFSWKRANPVAALQLLRKHPELMGLAMATWVFYLAHESLPSTFVLYTQIRFNWSEAYVGTIFGLAGVCSIVVQVGLVRPVIKYLGERRASLVGLCFGVAAFLIYGFAPQGWIFAIGIPVMSLWAFFGAASQGLMTRHMGVSEQGALQGSLNALRGIAGLIGPGLFTGTLGVAIGRYKDWNLPGAPFLLAAALLSVALAVAWRATRHAFEPAETRIDETVDPNVTGELASS